MAAEGAGGDGHGCDSFVGFGYSWRAAEDAAAALRRARYYEWAHRHGRSGSGFFGERAGGGGSYAGAATSGACAVAMTSKCVSIRAALSFNVSGFLGFRVRRGCGASLCRGGGRGCGRPELFRWSGIRGSSWVSAVGVCGDQLYEELGVYMFCGGGVLGRGLCVDDLAGEGQWGERIRGCVNLRSMLCV